MNTNFACRWGDNDHYLGPFTFALSSFKSTAFMLCSGNDEGSPAKLRVSLYGATMLVRLPRRLVPTERRWVDTSHYDWSQGRGGYWEEMVREFGVSLHEGHLSVHYGRQTHDSSTEQSWGCFLPWTQWRHVRHSLYGLDGSLFVNLPKYGARYGRSSWDHQHILTEACPTVQFAFKDYDGEELNVATKIEEREWRFGEKWCAWLSLFVKPKVCRSLDLRFSGEVGKRKGSWKGGTLGHSIEMLPGELHAAAFQRYCAAHEMTFVGPAALT